MYVYNIQLYCLFWFCFGCY